MTGELPIEGWFGELLVAAIAAGAVAAVAAAAGGGSRDSSGIWLDWSHEAKARFASADRESLPPEQLTCVGIATTCNRGMSVVAALESLGSRANAGWQKCT